MRWIDQEKIEQFRMTRYLKVLQKTGRFHQSDNDGRPRGVFEGHGNRKHRKTKPNGKIAHGGRAGDCRAESG